MTSDFDQSAREADALRMRALHDAHLDALLAFVTRRVDDPHDAADVVADTFVVAWRRLDDVPQGEGAKPWLFSVARRVMANHRRGVRRRRRLTARAAATLGHAIAEAPQAPAAVTAAPVAAALQALGARDREIVWLWALDDLTHQQIATVLGITPEASRVRLHRARNRLAVRLNTTHDTAATVLPGTENRS